MRLISQNREFDVPYEIAVLSRTGNIIRVYVPIVGEKGTVMARYSTNEKAKKAINAHNKKIANIEAFIRCAEEEQEKQKGKKDNETTDS